MKLSTRISLVAVLLASGVSAQAACTYPQAPQNLPNGGSATKEQMLAAQTTIKEYSKVQDVKATLRHDKRALALFTLGCNTAFRAGDMLRLTRDQLTLQDDGRYEIVTVEQKTQKLRRIVLNGPTSKIRTGLSHMRSRFCSRQYRCGASIGLRQ